MYGAILGFLIVLAAVAIWHVLKKYTRLSPTARMVLTALLTVLTSFVLLWLTVYASILLYQMNDPISWQRQRKGKQRQSVNAPPLQF